MTLNASFIYLSLAILFNALASICFKYSSMHRGLTKPAMVLIVAGLAMGAINALFYIKSLNRLALNVAYPILSAGSIILIALVSSALFDELLTWSRLVGIAITCIGLVLVTR